MDNKFDSRQMEHRALLRKLASVTDFDANGVTLLKNLLGAINNELTPAFEMYPTDPLNRVLNVASNSVSNAETSIRHTNPPISKQLPVFSGGTVTLPAASGGSVTVSPTITPNPVLTISANAFIKALVECDSLGNLSVTLGSEGATELLAGTPGLNTKAFQIGLLIIQTVAGVVQNVTGGRIVQFSGGGGSGGSGTGSGVKEPMPGYQFLEEDTFDVLATSTDSKITSTSYTNATQNLGKDLFKLSCDKSKTVNVSSGTALSISGGAPTFVVAVGDIVYVTSGARSGQWRRISAVGSQTSYTLDSAFTGGNAAGGDTLMISQAVWTKDLVNLGTAGKNRARDIFSGNVEQIAIDYYDSLAADDDVPDYVSAARVVASASSAGLVGASGVPVSNTFSPIFTRLAYPQQINDYVLASPSERLFVAFFCNPSNGSVTSFANLLGYECSFYADDSLTNGGTLDSAYLNSDGSGTPNNAAIISTSPSLTKVQMNWSYVGGVNPSKTRGSITVFVDGKEVPRYLAGVTTQAFYTEVGNGAGVFDTIQFHTDLTVSPVSIEVIRSEGIVDTANSNTSRITDLEAIVNRTTNYTMEYTGPQVIVPVSHTVYKVPVPAFTMNIPAGRYRFDIRMMGAVSMASGNEVAITIALSKNSASPGGANLVTKEYAVDGGLYIGGNQVTPSNPGWSVLTEELTLSVATDIYFAVRIFNTSGAPSVGLGIRGDLFNNNGSMVEAIRLGDA